MKVYRQPKIQDGDPKKVKALSLMVTSAITLHLSQFEFHIT